MAQKIEWDDKEQGIVSPLPEEKKFTYQNANEVKSKVNANADLLPIYLTSDISGVIDSVDLVGKNIGVIIGGAAIFEEGTEGDGVNQFSKTIESSVITMINGNSLIPNKKYLLLPR
jgi:hypothetical protein